MRAMTWLCASAFVAACAAEVPRNGSSGSAVDDSESEATSELGLAVMVNARTSDSLERIHAEAVAASAAACHGTTSCPGGVLISGTFTVDCGSPVCGTTGCGKTGGTLKVFKEQPREQYQAFAMPDGSVCLAYHRTISGLLTTCCLVSN
jgi:hypothetical protein